MTHALSAAADSSKPYDDVAYADPGYQKDKKKRYPLDTEEHCRAAWSYINMPKNAAKYSPEDLAKVRATIRAALKRYGADVQAAAASDLLAVELARPGAWKLRTGQTEITEENLRDAADFFAASGGQAVPIKLGHSDERFGDGEPTFGTVTNVRYHTDERGPVLLGDITGMPGWLAAAAPSRWPNRSIEGWQNIEFDGREYSLILSGLAFLGATPPAVRNVRSLADLQTALAASSAQRLIASAPEDDEATPPTPAAAAEEPEAEDKEAGMDPAKIRERLGLDDDVSDDDVMEALAYAGFVPAPEPAAAGEPAPVAAAAAPAKPPVSPKLAAAKPGTMTIDVAAWEEQQGRIKRLEAAEGRRRVEERDTVIATAVKDGKFPPARREHWVRLWDADPEGTRTVIDGLAKNVMPVAASGYAMDASAEDDELDREIAALSDPSRKAASRG